MTYLTIALIITVIYVWWGCVFGVMFLLSGNKDWFVYGTLWPLFLIKYILMFFIGFISLLKPSSLKTFFTFASKELKKTKRLLFTIEENDGN